MTAKEVVEDVRKSIENAKGTRLWDDFTNALNLISQVVFTRSSGFILELLQNAEDAGLGLSDPGVLQITLRHDCVTVQHNGRSFTPEDVEAISGIRSSKKPERGTLGYLGIGFKSVFKVSDCPEIHSGDFRFKFDRGAWPDPATAPWHVIPLWVKHAPDRDACPPELTTFIIPLRDGRLYESLREELAKIQTELFLFLKWLRRIEVADEPTGETWVLETLGEDTNGVTTLRQNGHDQRFKFFRRTVAVPQSVRQDRLTEQFRKNVTQREISIAFALDDAGNLTPSKAGAMYGGVYSFVPLGEASSGAKFPIQADFLVQPGRDAINYEAIWNHWLLDEVSDLCREAISNFKSHATWRFQFLPAFDFTQSVGHESYDKLFGPKLVDPVESFINSDACVPTTDGGWTLPRHAIRLIEDQKAGNGLVTSGILSTSEVSTVLGGSQGLALVDSRVKQAVSYPIKPVDRRNLLANEDFLQAKASAGDAKWFQALYRWLADNPIRIVTQYGTDYRVTDEEYTRKWAPQDGRSYRATHEPYHTFEFVLAADNQLHRGGAVHIPDFRSADALFNEMAKTLQKSRPVLHPAVLGTARGEQDRQKLRRFLTGRTGVQTLDAKRVCQEAVLPKIITAAPRPAPRDLLQLTNWFATRMQPWELPTGSEFWVLTKRAGVRRAREVVFGRDFSSGQDWETSRHLVPGTVFVSNKYLARRASESTVSRLRTLLKQGGVKEAPDNGVEDFAVNYTIARLKGSSIRATRVDKRNFGYDLQARAVTGERMRIEVKGQSVDQDVELSGNEALSADKYQGEYYLAVVCGIPDSPSLYVVNDPARVGKKDKLLVPTSVWRKKKWR